MDIWIILTIAKIIKDRVVAWGVIANFIMLSFTATGYKIPASVVGMLAFSCIMLGIVDFWRIMPREQGILFSRNPEWQKLTRDYDVKKK